MSNTSENAAAAGEVAEMVGSFFGGTVIGAAIFCYGLFFVAAKITGALVALDVGFFRHVFAVLGVVAILVCFRTLVRLIANLNPLILAIIYSAIFAILSRQFALETGWFGHGRYAPFVYFIVIFLLLAFIASYFFMMKPACYKVIRIFTGAAFGLSILLFQGLDLAVDIGVNGNYIKGSAYENHNNVERFQEKYIHPMIGNFFDAFHITDNSQLMPL